MSERTAVVCLSGGADSSTLFAYALESYPLEKVYPVHFGYGQRHAREYIAAIEVVKHYSEKVSWAEIAPLKTISVDLTQIGGSPLTDSSLDVPARDKKEQILTVVPYRNTIFLSLAAAFAETVKAKVIYYGAVADDFEAYRDCRVEFFQAMEHALSLGSTTESSAPILRTPFVGWSKAEIVAWGLRHDVPYDLTWTCYEGEEQACGRCDACVERIESFKANGVPDPLRSGYAIEIDWK